MHMMYATVIHDRAYVCPCVETLDVGGVEWMRERRCASDTEKLSKMKQHRPERTARRNHEEAESKERVERTYKTRETIWIRSEREGPQKTSRLQPRTSTIQIQHKHVHVQTFLSDLLVVCPILSTNSSEVCICACAYVDVHVFVYVKFNVYVYVCMQCVQ